MSTDSLMKRIRQTPPHSPNISDAEELEMLQKLQKMEEKSRMKREKKLDKANSRISELEKKVAEYETELKALREEKTKNTKVENNSKNKKDLNQNKLPQTQEKIADTKNKKRDVSNSNDCSDSEYDEEEDSHDSIDFKFDTSKRRTTLEKSDFTRSQYITYLENFADVKCDEVEKLLARLFKLRRQRVARMKHNQSVVEMKRKIEKLTTENEQLKDNFEKVKLIVEKFVINHRETKAERRTRELRELAKIQSENEAKNLELYSYITSQFRQFMNIEKEDLTAESVKEIVRKAAEMIKRPANMK